MKRIAVCVSGQFRHVHHRTPEQQVRQLLAFLAGVDCDVFVHGWHNSAEALILHELKPRAWRFEPNPGFGRLADRIRFVEPNIKPGRDEGSLAMFHALARCFKLVEPFADEYSHVLRIRPDVVVDYSLLEILNQIEAAGVVASAVYVPHMFHSKGVNDQIAFGPIAQMRIYCDTLTHVIATLDQAAFNPEVALLRNLTAHAVPVAFAHIPYSLMRERPIRINTLHERFHAQFGIWWSRTEWLPWHQDLSAYFRHKLQAVDDLLKGQVPALLYSRVPAAGAGPRFAIVRTRAVDNDPAVASDSLWRHRGGWLTRPYRIGATGVVPDLAPEPKRQTFVFRDSGELVMTEWRLEEGVLRNQALTVRAGDFATTTRGLRFPFRLARQLKALLQAWSYPPGNGPRRSALALKYRR